jgi:hypothetical protein
MLGFSASFDRLLPVARLGGIAATVLLMLQCSGGSELTAEQRGKLDAPLQRLVVEGRKSPALETTTRGDGTIVYLVLVRAGEPASLREAGLPVNSVSGDVVTARWSVGEIRMAARLSTVRRIEASGRAQPTSAQ